MSRHTTTTCRQLLRRSPLRWWSLLPALQVVAAAKHADRLGWLLQNAFATSVDLTGADADLALAVGVPALYRTLASLALQAGAVLLLCCAMLRCASRA